MQQQEDIQAAGLSLSECPFCDFKADYELAVDDKEFRCLNPSCGKTSCRLCEKETHIPMSCEEAKATTSSSARQKVEEAKSEALIRRCNRCRQAFIKELGCNKMTCPKCHNTQCYVCNADLTDGYKHFDKGPEGCPLHDREGANDLRHIDEVLNAETKAVAEARAANPNLTDAELGVDQNTLAAEKEKLQRKKNQRYPRGGRAGRNQPHGAFHGMAANNPFLMAPQNIQGFQAIDGDPNHRYPAFPPPPFAPAPVVAVPNPQYHVVGQGPGYQQPLLGHQVQEQIGQQPIGNLPPQVAGQFDQQYQVQIATMRAMRAQAAQQRRNLVQQQLLQLHQGAANQNYLAANPVNQHVAANQQIEANQQIPQANPQVARANQQIAQPNPTFGDAHNIIVQQPMIPLQQLQQAMPLPQQGAPWFGPQIGGPAAPPEEGPHVIHRFGGLFDF